MKLYQIVFFILFLCVAWLLADRYLNLPSMDSRRPAPTSSTTSYMRVMRTQTLRCGYEYWDGATMKDEKTGQVVGPWVDMMNAIGEAAGLKIEWTSQVGWSDVAAAIKSGKIDAMCAGMWTSAL